GARVRGELRPVRTQAGAAGRARGGAAYGPDAARHGKRVVGGGFAQGRGAATGDERSAYANGGAVPAAGGDSGGGGVSDSVLLKGVLVYGEGEPVDVIVADGEIRDIATDLGVIDGAEIVDGNGQILLPGFVDLHTHLREPGREDTETIESGSAAAALGGYTAVFAMANTNPVADSHVITDHVWRRGQEVGLVDVYPVGAVTVGLA